VSGIQRISALKGLSGRRKTHKKGWKEESHVLPFSWGILGQSNGSRKRWIVFLLARAFTFFLTY
jgi:hypothetical protein